MSLSVIRLIYFLCDASNSLPLFCFKPVTDMEFKMRIFLGGKQFDMLSSYCIVVIVLVTFV